MYKIERPETEKFSRVWNKGGIQIILTPEAIDFATAWANVVLNNFVQMCQTEAAAAAKKAAEPEKSKIIMEGI